MIRYIIIFAATLAIDYPIAMMFDVPNPFGNAFTFAFAGTMGYFFGRRNEFIAHNPYARGYQAGRKEGIEVCKRILERHLDQARPS